MKVEVVTFSLLIILRFSQPLVVQSPSCVWVFVALYGWQHARLLWPSLSPGAGLSSCPMNWWCHPTTSSSATLLSFCLQSFPASGSFPKSQLFASGGQSIEASTSTSVLPTNIQGWFTLGLTGLISLQSRGLLRVIFSTTIWKHLWCSAFFMVQLSHLYKTTGKTIAFG